MDDRMIQHEFQAIHDSMSSRSCLQAQSHLDVEFEKLGGDRDDTKLQGTTCPSQSDVRVACALATVESGVTH